MAKKNYKDRSYAIGKGKPDPKCQFKKGVVNNPLGARAHNPEKRALKELTIKALSDAIQQVITGTEQDAIKLINDPNTTLGHKVILRASIDAAKNGQWDKFNSIIERVLGKVATTVHIESPGGTMSPSKKFEISNLSNEELKVLTKLVPEENENNSIKSES